MLTRKKTSARKGAHARSDVPVLKQRKRLAPELRRKHILDAATRLIATQGYLPLSIEKLAQMAGSSKALVYTYFATQYELFNALLQREVGRLATAGFDTASRVSNLDQSVVLCAMLYFEHVVQSGPLLHILLTDLYMAEHVEPAATEAGRPILKRLVHLARVELKLSRKEVLAALEMLAAIPEEAGSLAFHKELDAGVARELCHSLILSGLEALRSPGRVTMRPDNVA